MVMVGGVGKGGRSFNNFTVDMTLFPHSGSKRWAEGLGTGRGGVFAVAAV